MKRHFLFFVFMLVFWAAGLSQSGELVGTFNVVSSTGADPTPTVTGFFSSTVGFLPSAVDTGDILMVRQVYSGQHRRKLYRITGKSGFSPLTLTLSLYDGISGGPFPVGATHQISRMTAGGSLLSVPNVSQEQASYALNYTIKNLEEADVDTTIERNDSMFVVLNSGAEHYTGPTAANGVDNSFQVGDSVFIVASGDTIFTGIAYANPGIDTFYTDGTNYYLVTTEGDTMLAGINAQVVANGLHPVNPPTYLVHIDTAGVDTVYFDNNGSWSRFNVGGSSIGAPLFYSTNANVTTFHPPGTPPVGSVIWNPKLGTFMRKYGPSSIFTISEPNGRNVYVTDRFYQADTLDAWDITKYASATLGMDLVNGRVETPLNLATAQRGGSRTVVIINDSGSPRTVSFSTKFRFTAGVVPLAPITMTENSELTLDFTVDVNDSEVIMRLTSPLTSGSSYTFQNQANGIDLVESGGTVTVAPNITELTFAAVANADSVMIWDNSANAHRRTSIADIVALASSSPVTVTDQANGLDITITGTDIRIAPDFGEVANTILAPNDSLLVYDVSAGLYRRTSAEQIAQLAGTPAGDNLGNHTATQALAMSGFDITGAGSISANKAPLQGYATYTTSGANLSNAMCHYVMALGATTTMTVTTSNMADKALFFVKNLSSVNKIVVAAGSGLSTNGNMTIPANGSGWFQRVGTVVESFGGGSSSDFAVQLVLATNNNGVYTIPHPFGSQTIRFADLTILDEVTPYITTIKSMATPGQVTFQVWNPVTGFPIQLPNHTITVLIKV